MKYLAIAIGYLLTFIYNLIGNYGISIIVLTLIVRGCLLPLYAKQIKFQYTMSELQSKITEIQTRYAADRVKMNEKIQELYASAGVNPTSGCLPMLIQFPIIIGLYTLLRNPLQYMSSAAMTMAVHEGFIWIPDLSQPDAWILPIIAGITTYFTYTVMGDSMDTAGAAGMTKTMKYFFPLMIFLMGRSFPAGLALYWAVGNGFTIIQSVILNKKKEKMKMEAKLKEEVKKSRKSNVK